MNKSEEPYNTEITMGALRNFKCSRCTEDKSSVIKLDDKLVCIQCRFNEVGKDALYEPLYSGF